MFMKNRLSLFVGFVAFSLLGGAFALAGDDMDWSSGDEAWEHFEDDDAGYYPQDSDERAEPSSARDGEEVDIQSAEKFLASELERRSFAIFGDSKEIPMLIDPTMEMLSAAAGLFRDGTISLRDYLIHQAESMRAWYQWRRILQLDYEHFSSEVFRARWEGRLADFAADLFRSHYAGYLSVAPNYLDEVMYTALSGEKKKDYTDLVIQLLELSQGQYDFGNLVCRSIKTVMGNSLMRGSLFEMTNTVRVILNLVEREMIPADQAREWLLVDVNEDEFTVAIEGICKVLLWESESRNKNIEDGAILLNRALSFLGGFSLENSDPWKKHVMLRIILESILNKRISFLHYPNPIAESEIRALIEVTMTLIAQNHADPLWEGPDERSSLDLINELPEEHELKELLLSIFSQNGSK